MKLQFKQDHIPTFLRDELEIDSYLNLFSADFPLIPYLILSPLSAQEGKDHFNFLGKLEKQIDSKNISLEKIIATSKLIPNPDEAISAIESNSLEQYHLHVIGNFAELNLKVISLEKDSTSSDVLDNVLKILLNDCDEDFGNFKSSPQIIKLQNQFDEIKHEFNQHITWIEQEIYRKTKLKMIYPYPHEITTDQPIINCDFIKHSNINNYRRIDFVLDHKAIDLLKKKNEIKQQLSIHYRNRLENITAQLKQLCPLLKNYIKKRKLLCWQYLIIKTKRNHKLIFPSFTNNINLENAILPSLRDVSTDRYCPLSISFKRGATVLFGANMTGKTSVLKTIYFHLQMTRFGLPVPAKKASFPFPQEISFLLRSSGNTQRKLSSFGEELNFFSKDFAADEYILVDELFHSTNPHSGIELSNIFLSFFKKRTSIFFCNSHYREVLMNNDIQLLRMKDSKLSTNIIEDLLKSIPFEIEEVNRDNIQNEDNRPLEVALHFPIHKDLKTEISNRIRHGKN